MNQTKKNYIILASFLAVSSIVLIFIIYPFFKGIKQYSQDLFFTRKDLAVLENKAQKSLTSKQELLALRPDLEKIQKLFISPEIPIEFLQFLEQAAEQSNVLMNISFSSQSQEEITFFPFLNIQLSVSGVCSDCLRFLEKLETGPYLIEIHRFTAREFTKKQLKTEKYQNLYAGNSIFDLSIKVFTNDFPASL